MTQGLKTRYHLCSSFAANKHDIRTDKISHPPVDLFSDEEEMMKQAGEG